METLLNTADLVLLIILAEGLASLILYGTYQQRVPNGIPQATTVKWATDTE